MHESTKSNYDVIIVGSGAGGGTLAYALSLEKKTVLVIERGDFIPKEKANRSSQGVSGKKYRTTTNIEFNGVLHNSYSHYYVGGATKLYGAALYRFRREDFTERQHYEGVSPSWPISYDDLEPYYSQAEQIYKVHGSITEDPTEPFHSQNYPFKPIEHETFIRPLTKKMERAGINVSYIPKAIDYSETGTCEFCQNCDGYACELGAKLDTEQACLQPAISSGYVDILTNAECTLINTNQSGNKVTSVKVTIGGLVKELSAPIYVISCGILDSTALLLRSANNKHPNGLANSSGLVGRYLSGHNTGVFLLPTFKKVPEIHQKTFAVNDFYHGGKASKYPLGILQASGRLAIWLEVEKWLQPITKFIVQRSIITFIMSEVIPKYENRVGLTKDGQVSIQYETNNIKSFRKLRMVFMRMFWRIGIFGAFCARHPIGGLPWHAVGTLRFGKDPEQSVLDEYCRTHDVDNLYVVDASFMPSAGSVNMTLTIMAQALRVAKQIAGRL